MTRRFRSPAQRKAVMHKVRAPKRIVRVKQLSPTEFDLRSPGYDWHLRLEGQQWILDQFNARIKDADEAHMASFEVGSKQEAIEHVRDEGLNGGRRRA